jgi:homoserine kinase
MTRPIVPGSGSNAQGDPQPRRDWVTVFAPATVANLGPGFDTLGVAVDGLGDTVKARRRPAGESGVTISKMTGDTDGIPLEPAKNCAGRAAEAVLRQLKGKAGRQAGIDLEIHKGLPQGSGLGSSAASSVAGAVAAHLMFGSSLGSNALLEAALEGEALASGGRHADNLAPALHGGFTIVRDQARLEVIRLEMPSTVRFVLILPRMEIETRYARSLLPEAIPLKDAVGNWANVAALVAAVARGNVGEMGRAMIDRVVEPVRGRLIPGFEDVKRAAVEAGASGCSISGAGPTLFALTTGDAAEPVAEAMQRTFRSHGLECRRFICAPDNRGARQID